MNLWYFSFFIKKGEEDRNEKKIDYKYDSWLNAVEETKILEKEFLLAES